MPQMVREFISEVDSVRAAVGKCKSKQLSSAEVREHVQYLVDNYFSNVRPAVAPGNQQLEALRGVDASLQELLQLSHGRGLVTKYKRMLKDVRAGLVEFDAALTTATALRTAPIADIDQKIIATLQSLVPSAAASYTQAMLDLAMESRASWRGPATDLREALREVLDHLAPDNEVMKESGFKLEQDAKGPTMKQKVRFVLKKRGVSKTASSTPEAAADSVETAIGTFVRTVYSRSSVSTHTPTDKPEVLRVRDWVRVTLCELLEIPT